MAKYTIEETTEDVVLKEIDHNVFEALDLGIDPQEIQKQVEESIAWGLKQLDKEEFDR
jgi:hypothetical protein